MFVRIYDLMFPIHLSAPINSPLAITTVRHLLPVAYPEYDYYCCRDSGLTLEIVLKYEELVPSQINWIFLS